MWADSESVADEIRVLIGKGIHEVGYLYPAGIHGISVDSSSRVHEVDHGIRLVVADGVMVTLMWQMDGVCSALSVVAGDGHDAGITDLVESYDVSDSPAWAPLIDRRIINVGVAWHTSERGCSVTPWAFRFEVGENRRFVVALAEMRGGVLAYIPDNIVAIFDDDVARSYTCMGSKTSSWGVNIL